MKERAIVRLLITVVALQGLALFSLWTGTGGTVSPAQAQLPDPAGQRIQVIEELRQVNGKLDRLHDLLRGGEVQVKLVSTDDSKAGPAR